MNAIDQLRDDFVTRTQAMITAVTRTLNSYDDAPARHYKDFQAGQDLLLGDKDEHWYFGVLTLDEYGRPVQVRLDEVTDPTGKPITEADATYQVQDGQIVGRSKHEGTKLADHLARYLTRSQSDIELVVEDPYRPDHLAARLNGAFTFQGPAVGIGSAGTGERTYLPFVSYYQGAKTAHTRPKKVTVLAGMTLHTLLRQSLTLDSLDLENGAAETTRTPDLSEDMRGYAEPSQNPLPEPAGADQTRSRARSLRTLAAKLPRRGVER